MEAEKKRNGKKISQRFGYFNAQTELIETIYLSLFKFSIE